MDPAVAVEPDVWRRILARDISLVGHIVFAVRTTGIYCRPDCPARRPKAENVMLFEDAAEAEAAGYRACKRCRPDAAAEETEAAFVERVVAFLESRRGRAVSLDDLAAHLGSEPSTLRRRFERSTGVTPHAYLEALRLGMMRERLRSGEDVRRATYASGFGSTRRAYTRVRERIGMTPGRYRRGGDGKTLRHIVGRCALGSVLVACTDEGLAAVRTGDDREALVEEVRSEFPHARHEPDPTLEPFLAEVLRRLDGQAPRVALPYDIRATAFCVRVYEALLGIPRGETRSYQELATSIGAPGAARAVGNACAANPLAGIIPCHRVVRADGTLGGYRWGIDRKRHLLDREADGTDD